MKHWEMFAGFSKAEQAKHEQYLVGRLGEGMKQGIAESRKNVKNWSKANWQKSGEAFAEICNDLAALMSQQQPADSRPVQHVVRRHCEWMKQFWTPNRESYAGHSLLIVDSDLRKAYEAHSPNLPEYMASAVTLSRKGSLDNEART